MNASTSDAEKNTSRLDSIFMIVCLLIALGLRLAVILNQPEQLILDRDAYLGIATNIAEGHGYTNTNSSIPTAFRPPLYPLVLAVGFLGFSVPVTVAGINLFAGLMTVWLTARLGQRLCLGRLRFVAALLVAVDPLLLQYASRPMTESLCTFLATLWLWLATADADPSKPGRLSLNGFFSGIAFGLLVLSRPTFWPITGFCLLYWLFTWWKTHKSDKSASSNNLWGGVWSLCGTMILVAPWVIRNWIIFGIPILTTTHGGYTLLLGNNPVFYEQVVRQPWGTTWPDASQHEWEANLQSQMNSEIGPQASETERDAWQSRAAKEYMKAEPWHCVESAIHRIRSLWSTVPQGDAASGINGWIITAVGWFYTVVLVAGFIGMLVVLFRTDRLRWFAFYSLIISVQAVHLFYWTNARMRAPLIPAISLFAVAAICRKSASRFR